MKKESLEDLDVTYTKALKVATEAHKGQTRWGGEPYITHPIAVAESISGVEYADEDWLDALCVAVLHDVVEDTSVTYGDLLNEHGFSYAIVNAVHDITKVDGESYANYIKRVSYNPIARRVKVADLQHNLKSLKKGSMKDKYMLALEYFRLYEEMIESY